LIDVLLVLLILIASLFLAQMVWQLVSGFSDLILLFLLGWLVSFILNPLVAQLAERPIPPSFVERLEPHIGRERAKYWRSFKLSRASAVAVVYTGLVLVLVVVFALFVPIGIAQSAQIGRHLPEYMARAPEMGLAAQEQLARYGLILNLEDAVRGSLGALQGVLTPMVQNALGIFSGIVNFVADLFFVLILGFYFTLDGPRLQRRLTRFIPGQYEMQVRYFGESVDRTLGAFIRGQLLQGILIAAGTTVAMDLLGLDFVLVASVLAGLVMLIPLVGPILALLPPIFVVLFQRPDLTLWLLILLVVFQFGVVNVIMPRVVGDAVGLHPLIVLGAILLSVKIAGVWGAFFGIPIAGVLWAMIEFFFSDWAREPSPPEVDHGAG
jgi:predicted PurR-regulated permease PerM